MATRPSDTLEASMWCLKQLESFMKKTAAMYYLTWKAAVCYCFSMEASDLYFGYGFRAKRSKSAIGAFQCLRIFVSLLLRMIAWKKLSKLGVKTMTTTTLKVRSAMLALKNTFKKVRSKTYIRCTSNAKKIDGSWK